MATRFEERFICEAVGFDQLTAIHGGDADPWTLPIMDFAVGSRFFKADGTIFDKVGAGNLAADWDTTTVSSDVYVDLDRGQEVNGTYTSTTDDTIMTSTPAAFTMTSAFADDYLFYVHFLWSFNNIFTDLYCEFDVGGSVFPFLAEPRDVAGSGTGGTDQRYPAANHFLLPLTVGSRTVNFRFRANGSNAEAGIHEIRIFWERWLHS